MVYLSDAEREPAYQERVAWPRYAAVADEPLARRWLSLLDARGKDEKTLDAYGRAVDDFLLLLRILGVAVDRATEEHVARYVQDMHGRGPRRPGAAPPKALKNATMRQRLAAVRSLYDDLLRRDLVAEHPCPRGALGRAGRGSVRGMLPRERTVPWIPDEEEWARFLRAARPEPLRNRAMILFAYEGALRRETLVGLELGDVDVSNRLVRLRPETMKGGRPGVVVTFSETTARAYVPYLHELKAQAGRSKASTKRVFRSLSDRNYGYPLTGSSWNKIVSSIAGRADLPGFTPHTFRHLRLTHMAQAGFEPLEIALYAGHSQIDTTMLYVHLSGRGLAAKIAKNMRPMEERIAASFAGTLD